MFSLKNLTVTLMMLAILVSSTPVTFAQDEPTNNSDTNNSTSIFLPLVPGENSIDSVETPLVTKIGFSDADRQATLRLWTREAIAEAEPLEIDFQAGPPEAAAANVAAVEVTGPEFFIPAGAPAADAIAVAQEAYPEDWVMLEEASEESVMAAAIEGTSQVYTSYFVNKWSAAQKLFPHTTLGRITFTVPGGKGSCSGTSISGNVMVTAAHCLFNTTNNYWHSNIAFAPAYRNGSTPFGVFPARDCWVPTAWVNQTGSFNISTWTRHDVGVCKMGTNSVGTSMNNAVGWLGLQANKPYVRHFHSFGYPAKNVNGGSISSPTQYLHVCVAESFPGNNAPEVRGLGCNMGKGKSGGAWVVGYAPGAVAGAVDGVVSGGYTGVYNNYGPRFNSNNIVPLCQAAKC